MHYIKGLLGVLSLIGLSGTIVGLGTANLLIVIPSIILTVSCAVGACIAERLEEMQNDLSTQRLPIPAGQKTKLH